MSSSSDTKERAQTWDKESIEKSIRIPLHGAVTHELKSGLRATLSFLSWAWKDLEVCPLGVGDVSLWLGTRQTSRAKVMVEDLNSSIHAFLRIVSTSQPSHSPSIPSESSQLARESGTWPDPRGLGVGCSDRSISCSLGFSRAFWGRQHLSWDLKMGQQPAEQFWLYLAGDFWQLPSQSELQFAHQRKKVKL